MEAVGAAASILAIAGAGIQISLKLIAFTDQVCTASKRIHEVGTDVSVTAGTLQELGELMNKKTHGQKSIRMFNPDQEQNILSTSTRCKEIFDELKDILSRASRQLRDVYKSTTKSQDTSAKIKLSKIERMKWPFLQPSMESLRSALRDAKCTLILVLQLVHLLYAQRTASLDREGQNDLIRMIAAMRRQQLAPASGGEGFDKGLEASKVEDSDSGDSSEVRTVLEAWSVTPNTLSDEAFQHFSITPIPVSQQQIVNVLKTSPQDFREIASIVDSLSIPERDAILGSVLGNNRSHLGGLTIRSISHQSWTGSHDLFGRVTGRKFKLLTERRVRISRSGNAIMEHMAPPVFHRERHAVSAHHHSHPSGNAIMEDMARPACHRERHAVPEHHHSHPSIHNGFYSRHRSKNQNQRRPARAHHMPPRSSLSDDEQRKQDISQKKRKEHTKYYKISVEEEEMEHQQERESEWDSPDSHSWTDPQAARDLSDDDLVKSLLAQYTDFEIGESLVQSTATPPPAYDESFAIPKRVPRPY